MRAFLRAFFTFAVPAIAGSILMAAPSAAAPFPLGKPEAAPLARQVQWGYGERREEYRERRDYDGDRWRERRYFRDDDRDDWRRREYRRRMFCRYHPEACGRY